MNIRLGQEGRFYGIKLLLTIAACKNTVQYLVKIGCDPDEIYKSNLNWVMSSTNVIQELLELKSGNLFQNSSENSMFPLGAPSEIFFRVFFEVASEILPEISSEIS